jgi:hypothetical protein
MASNSANVPHVLVVTDVGHDYDDAMALIMLARRHILEEVKIVGVIATLKPVVLERAKLALFILRCVGVETVEVAKGTKGTENDQKPFSYEFLEESQRIPDSDITEDYMDLAAKLFEQASKTGPKLRILSIGGLRDVWAIMNKNQELTRKVVEQVHIQGGIYFGQLRVDKERAKPEDIAAAAVSSARLRPNWDAANNNFDQTATENVYKFLVPEKGIRTVTYTKEAAARCSFKPDFFEHYGMVLGKYLKKAHEGTINRFFGTSVDPQWPHDKKHRGWLIDLRMDNETPQELKDALLAKTKDWEKWGPLILKHSLVVANDPLAALGCAGVFDDNVLRPQKIGGLDNMLQVGQEIDSDFVRKTMRKILIDALGTKHPTFNEEVPDERLKELDCKARSQTF